VLVSLKEKWPSIAFLNLDRVIVWYRAVRQGALQIPSNPMERVLFSLFHISKIDMSPVEVVWLFYAFESLLQTSVGQNFALIVKRLCLLLEADDKQSSLVRKLMALSHAHAIRGAGSKRGRIIARIDLGIYFRLAGPH
jgi:hypothetical protein